MVTALHPKADVLSVASDVCCVPKGVIDSADAWETERLRQTLALDVEINRQQTLPIFEPIRPDYRYSRGSIRPMADQNPR